MLIGGIVGGGLEIVNAGVGFVDSMTEKETDTSTLQKYLQRSILSMLGPEQIRKNWLKLPSKLPRQLKICGYQKYLMKHKRTTIREKTGSTKSKMPKRMPRQVPAVAAEAVADRI